MFIKNIILSIRIMLRSKLFSFLNIVGLAFGLACTILLYLWIVDEFNYNNYHEKVDRIYLVQHEQHYGDKTFHCMVSPAPMAKAFQEKYPEVEYASRYAEAYTGMVSYQNKEITQTVAAADANLLNIFTCKFIYGTKESFANGVDNIIISESVSKQYFGDENPVGKTLVIDNRLICTVQGVFKDFPNNTDFRFNLLIPFRKIKDFGKNSDVWDQNWCYTIVLLKPGVDYKEFETKAVTFLDEMKQNTEDSRNEVFLNPLNRLHLYDIEGGGRIEMVWLFGLIAFFILIIACFNYTNLATARAENRAKEIAVRKVLGASRKRLIKQFLGESFIFTFIALNFSLILVRLLLPAFNGMAGKDLKMDYTDHTILISLIAIWIFTSITAGIYPAFVLSSFKVVNTLKGGKKNGSKGGVFRKVLVIIQFSLSIGLIICSLVVNNQLKFLKNRSLKLDKENMIYIQVQGKMMERYNLIKQSLLEDKNIVNVTRTNHDSPYTVGDDASGWSWEGKVSNVNPRVGFMISGFDFPETFKIKMLEGRFFSPEFPSDTAFQPDKIINVVINKKFADIIGYDGVNEKILERGDIKYSVIGVIDDFYFLPVYQEMIPLTIFCFPSANDYFRYIFIRISGKEVSNSLKYIKSVFAKYNPGFVFDYGFLDDGYDQLYKREEGISKIMKSFTIFAILISCLGLFGLAAFSAQRRTKEIGIRKALGAPVNNLVLMLSKDMAKWVLISNIVAWPLAYYFMNNWLKTYPCHYELSIWIFILAGSLAFVLSLLTVLYQAITVSVKNPVDSLRYE